MKKRVKVICEHNVEQGGYIRELIFGANDGIVTTLALVAGLFAAAQSQSVILLAGFVALAGGAISMGLGNYISVKGQTEFYEAQVQREKYEIKHMPDVEKDEIRCIYQKKGFTGKLLEKIVSTITANKKRWLHVMLAEKLGITDNNFLNPSKAGIYIGTAFIIAGFIPLIPFIFAANKLTLHIAIGLSALFLFSVGAWKTTVTKKHWAKAGIESVIIGALATLAGYGVGLLFV